jgi:ATP-binding cassette subfamily B protein
MSYFSKRINEVLKAKIDIVDGSKANFDIIGIANDAKGKIEFKDVCFKYIDSNLYTLKNINLKINQGETVGIIGPTGCGKTTLVNLIVRFFDPIEGEVLVNDINIKNYQLADLRNKIGYCMQRSNLLNRTVEQNIGLNYDILNDNPTFEQQNIIKNSAKIAQAEYFIDKMPLKYNTVIDQDATNISGGQKQRLSIASAINKPHEILIFDDSFSALDFSTDIKLRNELKRNFPNSTKIFVTSRVSTIINVDKIIYLEKGAIVGIGKHKELLANNENYRQIVLNQLSEKEVFDEKK